MGTQSREQSSTTLQRKNGLPSSSSSSSSSTSSKVQTFRDAVMHFKKNDRVKTYDMQVCACYFSLLIQLFIKSLFFLFYLFLYCNLVFDHIFDITVVTKFEELGICISFKRFKKA